MMTWRFFGILAFLTSMAVSVIRFLGYEAATTYANGGNVGKKASGIALQGIIWRDGIADVVF